MAAASPRRRRPGRNATTRGCARRRGRCRARADASRLSAGGRRSRRAVARGRGRISGRCLTSSRCAPRVQRLRCFRGIDDLTALTIAAELGDARAFATAPRVMAFIGLVPSEHSSGDEAGARRASRRPAMRICAACSSKPPGTIATGRSSGRRSRASARRAAGASSRARGRAQQRLASPLSAARGPRQTETARRHRGRARAYRLCVGGVDPVI